MQASSTSHRHGPSPLDRTPRGTQRPDRAPCASTTCVPFHQAFVLVHFLDTIASATPSPSAPARPSVREVPGAWCPHGGGEIRRRYGIPPEHVSFAPVREASREGQSHPIRVKGGRTNQKRAWEDTTRPRPLRQKAREKRRRTGESSRDVDRWPVVLRNSSGQGGGDPWVLLTLAL